MNYPRIVRTMLQWIAMAWLSQTVESAKSQTPSLSTSNPTNPGSEVVVVYNRQSDESKEIALHYAQRRGVPTNQIIEIDVVPGTGISREDFRLNVERRLRRELEDRELLGYVAQMIPPRGNSPGIVRYQCVQAKIRYLVLTRGIPFQILQDPKWTEPDEKDVPDPMRRNDACVDNELALLPIVGNFNLTSAIQNTSAYSATNATQLHPTNRVLMVTRLDGPTQERALNLVDLAMEAEKIGLWGRAYFDLRNIGGEYALGDQWITNAATAARAAGFEGSIDFQPETLGPGFPGADTALYAGWYSGDADGPFTNGGIGWVKGAIAYHLHSFSGAGLRTTQTGWVGPLINQGVTATLGCTAEPYLQLTPNVGVLFDRLLQGWTFGEAAYASLPALSWQIVVVGDPLYRPFGKSLTSRWEEIRNQPGPVRDEVLIRRINTLAAQGKRPVELRKILKEDPYTSKSPLLQEKMALLVLEQGKLRDAEDFYESALKLNGTEGQKLRVLIALAALQNSTQQPSAAIASYRRIWADFPNYGDRPNLLKRIRAIAESSHLTKDLHWADEQISKLNPK